MNFQSVRPFAGRPPIVAMSGASGFVGHHLIRRLQSIGCLGHAISRTGIGGLVNGWRSHIRSDVLNGTEVLWPPIDWFVHLEVKQHAQDPTPRDCEEFRNVNVDGTASWLDWCTRVGVRRVLYFSSIKAVGESVRIQDESADGLPNTEYGRSKRQAEELVRAWASADSARTALIVRPAVIYGPGNKANIYAMVRAIDEGMFFHVGANRNVKSIVSIANVTAAVAHLLQHVAVGVHTFNVVDRQSYTVRELAMMISLQLGARSGPKTIPLPVARVGAFCGDVLTGLTGRAMPLTSQRLTALLQTTHFSSAKLVETGFVHPQATEQGLAEMIDWYRAHRVRRASA